MHLAARSGSRLGPTPTWRSLLKYEGRRVNAGPRNFTHTWRFNQMTDKSVTPASAIGRAIELAKQDADEMHMAAARKAAAWTERWGSRFDGESFEDALLGFERLTDADRQALREWRADLIDQRHREQMAA